MEFCQRIYIVSEIFQRPVAQIFYISWQTRPPTFSRKFPRPSANLTLKIFSILNSSKMIPAHPSHAKTMVYVLLKAKTLNATVKPAFPD